MRFHKNYIRCFGLISKFTDIGINIQDGWHDLSQEEYSLIKLLLGIDLLVYNGDFYIRGVPGYLSILPDNLVMGSSFTINDPYSESFPKNLTVKGDIYIRNSKLIAIPEDLTLGGTIYIDLSGANLKTFIPKKFEFILF